MESSVMLGSISFFVYTTALRRFFCVYTTALRRFFCDGDAPRHWRMPMWGGFCDGDGNQKAKATAEGRLYNHSPRLACLPGVSRGIIIYRRRAVV